MIKILLVFGTRPEAIKMAPLVRLLSTDDRFEYKVCVTAQHREMLDQVLKTFSITPDYDLNLMRESQNLTHITTTILTKLQTILDSFSPKIVLVHGDTSTCFATSLAAYYAKIKVAHIEAGLRTGDIFHPWPEEANRALVSKLADIHFAPTEIARKNLLQENISDSKIIVSGNTVIDSLLLAKEMLSQEQKAIFPFLQNERKMILMTAHRRESFGKEFNNILEAITTIAKKYPHTDIVYPVHPNKNIHEPAYEILSEYANIHLITPQSYLDFIYLMNRAYFILTDSGGIQEEAPSLKKPVLVLRNKTERPEAVAAGVAKVIGTNPSQIISSVSKLLEKESAYLKMIRNTNPYGDGKACQRILETLANI